MKNYVRYKEERKWVYYRNPKEKVDCIVTTFYDERCACSIVTKLYELEVGDSVTVKSTGHTTKIKEVRKFHPEYGYGYPDTVYILEEPDPKGSSWYYRRNLY